LSTVAVIVGAAVILFSGRKLIRDVADLAYRCVVEQARRPIFFTDYGVPDTFDGRFELICLHAFLYLHRLKLEGPEARRICQHFFDRMFSDFDRALRETGTGDLSVGSHVKRMALAFYGRIRAYREGLASGDPALGAALARNLFGTVSQSSPLGEIMAVYVRNAVRGLCRQAATDLLAGRVLFKAPPAPGRCSASGSSGGPHE
jgi:cytochrome b pre-mRNA-processing protein 3